MLAALEETGLTEHAFFVLENGTRVAKRKTHNDAAACALRMKYISDHGGNSPGKAEKKFSRRREHRAAGREIREAL